MKTKNRTFAVPKRARLAYMILLLAFSLSHAGIPGYYFQELSYNFWGADSNMVNSLRADGSDGGSQSRPYGLVIDPEGKRWLGFYAGYSRELELSGGNIIRLCGLRCFLPDGREAAFSPIEFLDFPNGSKDTLYIGSDYNGAARGLSLDADGNILYTARSTLYKINYRDGSGMARWYPGMDDKPVRTFVKAAHDDARGHIYLLPYPQQETGWILNENLELLDTALTRTPTLQNAAIVRTTNDSLTQLLVATHANGIGILLYESPDPLNVPFMLSDTIGNYTEITDSNTITYLAWPSSLDWLDREAGIVIFGNDYRALTEVSSGTAPKSPHASRWFIWDINNDEMIAMFGAPWYDDSGGYPVAKEVNPSVPSQYLANQAMVMRPSGAFVASGTEGSELYITDMDLNCVQRLVWSQTAVEPSVFVPYDLHLEQNYPNPFNPETRIRFTLQEPGYISLSLHTLSGKKLMEIQNAYYESGRHLVTFNAAALPSGTYLYTLSSKGFSLSRKMTLIK